jgi:hypothetical protein
MEMMTEWRLEMRRRLIAGLGLAIVLLGCGTGAGAGPTGGGAGPTAGGATVPAGNGAGGFCDAALRLELADASNRQEIQAGLEAATPPEMTEEVAVVREFMERQASGDDPYKDPDFLDDYDDAVHDIWDHCGR